jgi:tetraacyldisaccharide 4'-kinase
MRSLHDVATRFWNGELGAAGTALDIVMIPASALFNATASVRNALYDLGALPTERVPAAVISVGNIAVGGTGKTPVTAWIARALRESGRAPAVLHGGYAADEPALHAVLNPDIPVLAGRDRITSAGRAIARGADVLVLDDAFQHRRIHRDLDIVLVAAESWPRARHVLPRGPWREEDTALRRASWVVVTRRTASAEDAGTVAREIRQVLAGSAARVAVLKLAADSWTHAGAPRTPAPRGDVFAVLQSRIRNPSFPMRRPQGRRFANVHNTRTTMITPRRMRRRFCSARVRAL